MSEITNFTSLHTTKGYIGDVTGNVTGNISGIHEGDVKTTSVQDLSGTQQIGISASGVEVASDLTVGGNLIVQGDTTTLDVQTLQVEDFNVLIGKNNQTSSVISGSGITLDGGSGSDITFQYGANQYMYLSNKLDVTGEVKTTLLTASTGVVDALYGYLTGDVVGNVTGQVSSLANHSTTDLGEGVNLYYTTARADARVDLQTGANLDLSQKTTTELAEGNNKYYTEARVDANIAGKTTDDLTEGTDLYYTDARVQANRLDQMTAPTNAVDMNSQLVQNVATPNVGTDAANSQYVLDKIAEKDHLSEMSGTTDDLTEGTTNLFLTPNTQNISGAKTFTNGAIFQSSIVVPTPVSGTQAANKDYVDTAIASIDELSELIGDTDNLTEGTTNLFYTDARVQANRLDEMAAPTNAVSMNSQQLTGLAAPSLATDASTKGYVDTEIADLVNSAPATLDTLNELAAALGNDPNLSATLATQIGELNTDVTDVNTALGITENDTDFGSFTGSTISASGTAKAIMQELETAVDLRATIDNPTFTTKITTPVIHTPVIMSQNAHLKIGSEHTNDLNIFLNNAETLQINRSGTEVRYQSQGGTGTHRFMNDISGNGNIDIATGKVYKINGSQITHAALADSGDYSTTAQRNVVTDLLAPLASPSLTGTPVAPTATAGTNTTQIATTEFVQSAISTKDHLSELAGDTDDVSEGTSNLYYTNVRADARIAAASVTDLSDVDQALATTDAVTFEKVTINQSGTDNGMVINQNHANAGLRIDATYNGLTIDSASNSFGGLILKAYNSDDTGLVVGTDGHSVFSGNITAQGTILLSGTPSSSSHAINKGYVDTVDNKVDKLTILSGVASLDTNLGTFTGSTISDNSNVKQALQSLETDVETKANAASTALTGIPTAPTASAGTSTTQIATTAFVGTAVDNLVAAAPGALDTLNELAAAINDDASFSTTVTNLVAANEVHIDNMATLTGVAKDSAHVGTFTGSTISDNGTVKAGMQELETALELRATLASPALTGSPTAPTATAGNSSTAIATTAFVTDAVASENTLEEMNDVAITSIADNDVIAYDSSTSKYINQSAAEAGLATAADLSTHNATTSNPHSVTAEQVGLGNVDNESKATMFTGATLTGTPTAPTASVSTNTTQIATTAFVTTAVAAKDALSELSGDTDDVSEGTSNLYYTDARARASISENSTQLAYNSSSGVLTYTQGDTDTVSEGSSNLYYTDARAQANRLDEMAVPTSALNINMQAINFVGAPAGSTDAATKGYVDTEIAGLVASAPATLDTLNELAAALGDDPNYATTISTQIGEIDTNVNDVISLTGIAENTTSLGTFSGSTITDSSSIKTALQELETAVETKATSTVVTEIDTNVDNLITAVGATENQTHVGTFTGSTISDNGTIKAGMQELETSVELKADLTGATFSGDLLLKKSDGSAVALRLSRADHPDMSTEWKITPSYVSSTKETLSILAAGQPVIHFDERQRVAINTTDPDYTLDVGGDGRFTTNLDVEGNASVSGTLDAAGIVKISGGLKNHANDSAAALDGVGVNELYRNGSIVMIRVS